MTNTRGKLKVTGFIFLGFKITVDGVCSHKIKRFLLLGRKAMTNPDSVLKSRDITLPKKVHMVKRMVFAVVVYGYESWTIEKAECQRSHSFELWCWRKLARRSNQSILKEISPEYSLEGLMLKLKLQYFGHLMPRADSLGKDPDSGKDWEEEEKGTTEDEMDGITDSVNMILSKLWEILKDWEACHAAVHGVTKSQISLSDWTTTTELLTHFCPPHFEGDGNMALQGFAQTQHDIQTSYSLFSSSVYRSFYHSKYPDLWFFEWLALSRPNTLHLHGSVYFFLQDSLAYGNLFHLVTFFLIPPVGTKSALFTFPWMVYYHLDHVLILSVSFTVLRMVLSKEWCLIHAESMSESIFH